MLGLIGYVGWQIAWPFVRASREDICRTELMIAEGRNSQLSAMAQAMGCIVRLTRPVATRPVADPVIVSPPLASRPAPQTLPTAQEPPTALPPSPPQQSDPRLNAPVSAERPEWCSKAQSLTVTELAICSDRLLSASDVRLNFVFWDLYNHSSRTRQQQLRQEEDAWRRARDTCGNEFDCLRRAYFGRIRELAGLGN